MSQERVKLIAFLQNSTHYNLDKILNKLLETKILKAELAIIYGKVIVIYIYIVLVFLFQEIEG